MFIQVIRAHTSDGDGVRRLLDRWVSEVAPGADGWLGATGGVTDGGDLVAVVRFTDAKAARRNSDRPEQGAWWEEMERHLDGAATFHDCERASEWLGGGRDDAGFVQVIEGRADDVAALISSMEELDALVRERPEIIGGTFADHGDGGFTETVYFTSEQEARAGEAKELSTDLREAGERYWSRTRDLRYLDLREPWVASP